MKLCLIPIQSKTIDKIEISTFVKSLLSNNINIELKNNKNQDLKFIRLDSISLEIQQIMRGQRGPKGESSDSLMYWTNISW